MQSLTGQQGPKRLGHYLLLSQEAQKKAGLCGIIKQRSKAGGCCRAHPSLFPLTSFILTVKSTLTGQCELVPATSFQDVLVYISLVIVLSTKLTIGFVSVSCGMAKFVQAQTRDFSFTVTPVPLLRTWKTPRKYLISFSDDQVSMSLCLPSWRSSGC